MITARKYDDDSIVLKRFDSLTAVNDLGISEERIERLIADSTTLEGNDEFGIPCKFGIIPDVDFAVIDGTVVFEVEVDVDFDDGTIPNPVMQERVLFQ